MAYKSKFMQEMEQQGKLSAASGTSKYKSKFFQEGGHLEKEVAPAPMRTPTDRTFTGVKTTPAATKPVAERPTEQQNQISGEIAARTAGAGSRDPIGTAAHMTKISGLQMQEAELKLNQSKAKLDAARQKEMALTEQSKKLASAQQGLRQLMTQYEMSGDDVTGQAYLLAAEEYNKLLEQYQKDYAEYEKDASVYDEYNSNLLKYQKAYAAYEKSMVDYDEVVKPKREYEERLRHVQELRENQSVDYLQAKKNEIENQIQNIYNDPEYYNRREIYQAAVAEGRMTGEELEKMNPDREVELLRLRMENVEREIENKRSASWEAEQTAQILEAGGEQLLKDLKELASLEQMVRAEKITARNPDNNFTLQVASKTETKYQNKQQEITEKYGQIPAEWYDYAKRAQEQESYDSAVATFGEEAKITPVAASVLSVPLNVFGGIAGMGNIAGQKITNALLGKETPTNFKNAATLGSAGSQAMRQGVSELIESTGAGKVGSFLYNTGMSMLDSAAILGLSALGVPSGLGTTMLGSSAAISTLQDAMENGATENQALALGILAGLAEGFFEKYSIDSLIEISDTKTARDLFMNILKQGGIEASEEAATTLANTAADLAIMGNKNQLARAKRDYMSEGLSEQEAEIKAGTDWLLGLAMDAVGGFLSGGLFGTIGGTVDMIQNKSADKKAQSTTDQVNTADTESTVAKNAADNENTGLRWAGNQNEGGTEDVRTEQTGEPGADGNIGRADDLGTGERTGSGTAGDVTGENGADQTARYVEDLRRSGYLSEVKSETLGFASIESKKSIAVIRTDQYNEAMQAQADKARAMGVEFELVADRIPLEQNGKKMKAAGLHKPGKILVQANNAKISVEQATDHELFHELAERDPELVNTAVQTLQDEYDQTELDEMYQKYAKTYGKAYNDGRATDEQIAQRIYEEMLADAYADYERFAGNKNARKYRDTVRRVAADSINRASARAETGTSYAQTRRNEAANRYDEAIQNDPRIQRLIRQRDRGQISEAEYMEQIEEYFEQDARMRGMTDDLVDADKESFSFAGRSAETADQDQKRRAEEMEKQGMTAAEIYEETGWYRGKDRKWRFELDDSQMEYSRRGDLEFRKEHPSYGRYRDLLAKAEDYMIGKSNEWLTMEEQTELTDLQRVWTGTFKKDGQVGEDARPKTKLIDYIKHDALFEAYPQLRNTSLVFEEMERGDRGRYNRSSDTIFVNENLRHAPEDVLIHELQHAIQQIEGFAGGSSVEYWDMRKREGLDIRENDRRIAEADREYQRLFRSAPEELQDKIRAINRAKLRDDWDTVLEIENQIYGTEYEDLYVRLGDADFDRRMERGDKVSSVDLYRNTAGEIEARNAAERRKLTKEQRREMFPELGDENTVFTDSRYAGWAYSKDYDGESASIKQQIENSLERLNQMDVVASVTVPENLQKKDAAVKWATEILKPTGYRVDRQGYGEIFFAKDDLDQGMRYADTPEEKAAVVLLPKVLKRGIEIGSHGNHKNRAKQTFTIAAPVEINGQRGNMAVVVNRHGNRYYAHRIVLPDGTEFRFADKNINAAQELSRGVTENGSLAKTTSAASETIIDREGEGVNTRFSVDEEPVGLQWAGNAQEDVTEEADPAPVMPEKNGDSLTQEIERAENGLTGYMENQSKRTQNRNKALRKQAAIDFAEALGLQTAEGLTETIDEIANEYLVNGRVGSETRQRLFKIMPQREQSGARTPEQQQEWAWQDFNAAVNKVCSQMAEVRRYMKQATDNRQRYQETENQEENVAQLWVEAKVQRREMEKNKVKFLLTDSDKMAVGRLLRGEIQPEHINRNTNNYRGIMAVYEASQAYEDTMKKLRAYSLARKEGGRQLAADMVKDLENWKDKKNGIAYSTETMERNIRKIAPTPEIAEAFIDAYLTPVHKAAAQENRLKNAMRKKVADLKLSQKAKKGQMSESAAVQLLGEARDNISVLEHRRVGEMRDGKTLEEWKAEIDNLWRNNPQLDRAKIEHAIEVFREIYDQLFKMMNETRIRNGYEPINYRKGYFPHFQTQEVDGIFAAFGKAFGIQHEITNLPASIVGLTENFLPGIPWFQNAMKRLAGDTTLDAVQGFDQYLEGAANVIYQTDNIQRLRTLEQHLRYMASDPGLQARVEKIRENPDKSDADKQSEIDKLYKEARYGMTHFISELQEYTNNLANKKSRFDRNMEIRLGRNMYNVVKAMEGRVAANMVAINPGSWLTNFAPLAQGTASVGIGPMVRGMASELKNGGMANLWRLFRVGSGPDGFYDRSTFLTNRRGSERLVQSGFQQVTNVLSSPMQMIDNYVSGSLVRARYMQNLKSGMSMENAMDEADAWAAGIMGDRSKGAMPTIFNEKNPVTKIFTMYQLEVKNQFSWLLKDLPREKREKGVLAIAWAMMVYGINAWLFNELYEFVVGRRPAFDVIGILNDTAGDFFGYEAVNAVDFSVDLINGGDWSWYQETQKQKPHTAAINLGKNLLEEAPFVGGLLGGGRIPISSALPNVENLATAAFNSEWDLHRRAETIWQEMSKPLYYIVPPFGGGQVKKAVDTSRAIANRGSYSASGNLQYPVFADETGDAIYSALVGGIFGKTSLETGVEWVDSGFQGLNEKYTGAYRELIDMGEGDRASWELLQAMRDAEVPEGENRSSRLAAERRRILRESSVSGEAKYMVYYDLLASDKEKERMDALEGADPETVFNLFADMKEQDNNGDKLAILRSALTEQEKAILFDAVKEKENARLQAATKYVDSFLYADFLEAYAAAYTGEDGTVQGYSAERVEKILKAMNGVTNEEKAAIWQITANGKEGKSNPFSTKIGKEVWDTIQKLYDQIEEDGGLDWAGRY